MHLKDGIEKRRRIERAVYLHAHLLTSPEGKGKTQSLVE
jgi:hypothetical protein